MHSWCGGRMIDIFGYRFWQLLFMTRVWGWESDACQPTHGDNTIHLTCHGLNTATRPSPSCRLYLAQQRSPVFWSAQVDRYLDIYFTAQYGRLWSDIRSIALWATKGQSYMCIFSSVCLTPIHTLHTSSLDFWSGQITSRWCKTMSDPFL